jgi:anti-anti-sigma regulatory factor
MTAWPPSEHTDQCNGHHVADGTVAIIEVRGTMHRSTVAVLANHVRRLVMRPNTSIVIDLSDVTCPDYWLVSALARAHAAARARGANVRVIVSDPSTVMLLETGGFTRTASVFHSRAFDETLNDPGSVRRSSRANERQLAIDLRTSSRRANHQSGTPRSYALLA